MAAARDRPGFRIAVFDDRRGNTEGEEEEKLLAFWPSDTPLREQIAAVGLIQAMAAFMGTFAGVRPTAKSTSPMHVTFFTLDLTHCMC